MPGIKRTRNQVKSSSSSVKKHSASKSRSSKRRLNKRESKAVAKVISRDICRADSDADTVEMNVKLPEGIQVDNKVPNSQEYSIARFIGNHLSCHLMFTDCKNNNNKFYIVQGLKKGKFWFLWTRWGRVGFDGQNWLKPYTNRYSGWQKYKRW